MRLLVKRDKTSLTNTEGESVIDDDLPFFLKTPKVVLSHLITEMENRLPSDDLLIQNNADYEPINYHLSSYPQGGFFQSLFSTINREKKDFPAIWSGYRSVLVKDTKKNNLFRLKGVSLNPANPQITEFEDGTFWIQGGQKKQNLEYERQMSNKFNNVLLDNGIQPIMRYRGMWKYPILAKRNRLAASIYQVEGDTRLDELMFVLDYLTVEKLIGNEIKKDGKIMKKVSLTSEGKIFLNTLSEFYHNIGFTTGRLKRLMDKSGQTWSCYSERSNAHTGNIVVYNGTNKLKVGFVDFDASCDSRDYTKSEIRDLQKIEYNTIQRSVHGLSSIRTIGGRFLKKGAITTQLRDYFLRGFAKGYEHNGKEVSNEIDIGLIEGIFLLLRDKKDFSFRPSAPRTRPFLDVFVKDKYKIDSSYSLDKVIHKNKYFQDNLLDKTYNSSNICANKYHQEESLEDYLDKKTHKKTIEELVDYVK